MQFFLGLVHVQCTFQESLRGKSAWIMIMNDGAVSWIIFSIQIPLFFPKHSKRPTLTPCLPQPNTTSNRRPFSMTRVCLFKQLERPEFLLISYVWVRDVLGRWLTSHGTYIYILGRQGMKSQENKKFFPTAKRAFLHYNKLFVSSENVSNTCTFTVMSNKSSENGYCISHSSSISWPHSNFLCYTSSESLVNQGWTLINYWDGTLIIFFEQFQ